MRARAPICSGRFDGQQAATVHEAMGKIGALDTRIRPAWFGAHVCGAALTVQSRPGDNLMLHKAVSMAKPGDVLVVHVDGFPEAGMWGEILTVATMQKGIRGLVIDGGVRDTMPIKELDFPMFSLAYSIKGTTKMTPGCINHPIVIGGVTVNPGDIVIGDNDGCGHCPAGSRGRGSGRIHCAGRERNRHHGAHSER